ncbi:putative odorant receptor 85e [Chironomus tepperi]|uniref:putative odorant receptor 85e n=1 Tax=Chironomus tepperi TaxID=113505 RepID=UPI00391F69FA
MKTFHLNLDENLDETINYLMTGSIYGYGYFILCYMQIYSIKFLKLIDFANKNFRTRSAKGLTFISVDESVQTSRKFIIIWNVACLIGTYGWIIYPIVAMRWMLPFDIWYPFNVNAFGGFSMAYIFQIFGQTYVGLVYCKRIYHLLFLMSFPKTTNKSFLKGYGMSSGMYASFVMMLCGQYDILYANLKNLGATTQKKCSKKIVEQFKIKQMNFKAEEQEVNQYLMSTERIDNSDPSARVYLDEMDALADCMKHHEMILQFGKMLQDVYSIFSSSKLFYSTFLQCFLAYALSSMMEFSWIKMGNLFNYFSLCCFELLLFCYCGEILKHHSCRCGEALMRSNWESFNVTIRRGMIIILSYAINPIELLGMKINALNVDQFRAVMGTTFSYYTLLMKMKERRS